MEEPEELTFQFLREITDGFSEERKVGGGAFGEVYRGVTKNGQDVAVKILRDGGEGLDYRQFRNEFYNLRKVKHNNIVQVLGYCYEIEPIRIEYYGRIVLAEKTHKALCFEYLHNGSLQRHLSDESSGLDWDTRYRIIKGTCEGLKYIHKDLGESLLHLDLKPDNILVDKNMEPKIADFGLSRIFGDKLSRTTRSPLGTLGYQPPEYIKRGEISKKFDIFSLGVIIIRIVSGSKGYSEYLDIPSDEFIYQVQRNWRKRWQATCSSSFLLDEACVQVETCTQIALNCLENDSHKRPDIVEIINKLNEIETDNDKPPQKICNTLRGMTMHNEMKQTKEHMVIIDQHQQSNFIKSSRRNETESDSTQKTSLDAGKELIVGREEEKKEIASSLESMSERIIIFPICGIGGIGKTTFARLIYNDTNFKYYSQVWVYVSPRFDLFEIGNSIISQLSGKENQANELQLIKSCLTNLLSGKKILIVLDDLWENNTIQLMDLKDMLNPGDSIKTIVLVTTRSEDIAKKICSNIEPYKIEALTDEMCWDIIRQKSGFEARHDKEKLVGIGKNIALKCGGVALAAQTLGSMLQSKKYDEWMTVKDSEIWNETISNDTSLPSHVLASLKLSYAFSMDDSLKACFTYCAIFPKGHKIVKYDLIYQWISMGFIKPTLLSTSQLCEKYIMCLLGLTFLQHSRTYGACEDYTAFTMHDLVHDLAVSLLGDTILDQSKQGNSGGSSCRYALLTDCSKPLRSCTASPATLRALRFLDCRWSELHGAAFEPAKSLRVLDLSECFIQKLPDSIGQLKKLGYFNAPRIRDRMIPECITTLCNLRYLGLHGSRFIRELPESIGEMEDLVHLDLSGCMGIEKLPESFGNLTSLEHLDFTDCKNVTGVSQCLANLTKLKHLNLSKCKNIGDQPTALGSLTELQYLNLSDSSYLSGNNLAVVEILGSVTKLKYLLGSLTELKYLNMSSSNIYMKLFSSNERRIISSPESLGSLTELQYLNLSHHYIMGKLLPSFGKLCNLVHLDLSYCYPLQGVPAALNGLTKLQYLDLYKCSGFDAMEGQQEAFGKLSELRHLNLGCCVGRMLSYNQDKINDLLGWICTLTNLEYLSLRENNSIYSIPETLANLRKLHTLDLLSCSNLLGLPASICEIDSLKFLYTKGCWKLDLSTLPRYKRNSEISPYHTGDGESSIYLSQIEDRKLKISKLENVKWAKEAPAIKLMEKSNITELSLEWTKDAKRFVDDAEVLNELEPPHSVSEFRLEGYNSSGFPLWVMHIGACLPGLTSIDMLNLPNCHYLPPLGRLPNLKWLEFRGMDSIKKIDANLYGGTKAFPRLEQFHIDGMKCLEEWNRAYSSDEDCLNEPTFPCLKSVKIRHCPRLTFKQGLPQSKCILHSSDLASLTELEISDCNVIVTLPDSMQQLTHLRTLTINGCESIVSLPEELGDLTALEKLEIWNCNGVTTLLDRIQQLTSLWTLTVKSCKSIVALPDRLGDLASLTELEISDCNGITTLPDSIQQLTNLQILTVSGCESIVSLPEGLGDLTSLEKLEIWNCNGLMTLPDRVQQLTSLRTLSVRSCKSIVSLPEWLGDLTSLTQLDIIDCNGIKTLPDSINKLTCLNLLLISHCHELVRWCKLNENKMKVARITKELSYPEFIHFWSYFDEESDHDEEYVNLTLCYQKLK